MIKFAKLWHLYIPILIYYSVNIELPYNTGEYEFEIYNMIKNQFYDENI